MLRRRGGDFGLYLRAYMRRRVAPSAPDAQPLGVRPVVAVERLEEVACEALCLAIGEYRVALRAHPAEPEQRERITRSGGVVVEEAGR